MGKGGGLRPQPFPVGFWNGSDRLDPQNQRNQAPELKLREDPWVKTKVCGRFWVPEGNLAGSFGGACLKSGRPRGPGKALRKAGSEAPDIFEGFPGPPGPGQTSKMHPQKSGQTAFKYPALEPISRVNFR